MSLLVVLACSASISVALAVLVDDAAVNVAVDGGWGWCGGGGGGESGGGDEVMCSACMSRHAQWCG
eukprot:1677609-Rhodomonas_salina.1